MDRTHVARIAAWLVALSLLAPAPARTGGLSFVEVQRESSGDALGLRGARDVIVVDETVYVVGNQDDTISAWTRDFMTNALTFVEFEEDGVGGVDGMHDPTALVGSIDGNCVYVATEDNPSGPAGAGAVVVFNRSGFTGGLTFLEVHHDNAAGVDGIGAASAIAISLDDKHVYVAGEGDDAIALFSRTAPACALTFVGFVKNGLSGVQGLDRPLGVAVSDDGGSVYAAARVSVGAEAIGTVVAFSRNSGTGALTYLETQQDGVAGVDGLTWPVSAVLVSGFGKNVYATSQGGDAVVAFTRNLGTGALTYLETERLGGLAKGFRGASGIVTSPSDNYVYVTGRIDDALAVFKRDFATGKLEFLEHHTDLDPDVDVLGSAEAVAVVSDFSGGVYAVGSGPDTLVAFTEDRCGNGTRGVDEQCDDGNFVDGDGCSSTCRLELCGPLVTGTCHAATAGGGAILQIKDQPDDRKDQLRWSWKGQMTPLSQYGDPVTTADYAICIYDGSGNPQPLVRRAAPVGGLCAGKPCWVAKPKQFLYGDNLLTPDGVKKTQLKEGLLDDKPRVRVQGAGLFIDPPTLPLTLPVTVQVKNTQNLECWEATFSTADKNEAAQFKAKSD